MMFLQEFSMHCIQPIQRIEEKCSWWELSFEEENDECSSSFAEHSAVVSTTLSDLFDDDNTTIASACDDMSVASTDASISSISSTISKKGKKKKKIIRTLRQKSLIGKSAAESEAPRKQVESSDDIPRPPPTIDTLPSSRMGFLKAPRTFSGTYIGFKERAKRHQLSDERKGLIKSALYTCMEEDEEDLFENYLRKPFPNIAAN
jgi:hypothetical protein